MGPRGIFTPKSMSYPMVEQAQRFHEHDGHAVPVWILFADDWDFPVEEMGEFCPVCEFTAIPQLAAYQLEVVMGQFHFEND